MVTGCRGRGLGSGVRARCLARVIQLVVCLGSVAVTGFAHAQVQQEASPESRVEEAKALFTAGRAAFDAGRFADALRHFEQAYEVSQRPALLYNIGLAHDRLRSDEKALAAFEAYLAALPEAPNRAEVETRAQALRDAIARDSETAAPVPTPAETAAAGQPVAASSATGTPKDSAGKPSILTRWWFWTIVGVVAAGAITTGVLVAGGGDTQTQDTLPPMSGVVVTTLGSAR